jgi:uncharacterized membrane protein (UPF0136 family)
MGMNHHRLSNPDACRGRTTPRLIVGLSIMAAGALLTLENLGLVESRHIFQYWPALLVVIGVSRALQPRSGGWRGEGLLWVSAGVLLLLGAFGILHVRFRDLWPLLLLAIGGNIAWRALRPARRDPLGGSDSTIEAVAFLGGVGRKSASQDFRGGDLMAVLGGCEIDLRDARITNGEVVLEASAFLGGIEIRVPEDWLVVTRGWPLLGGFEDSTKRPKEDTGQRLVVTGFAILGGVEVKN